MTALSNEIEPESDDQQEVKRLKLENASLKEKLYMYFSFYYIRTASVV
jgi:cell shape-determining protein MreC